ncbi:MAG: hypothetical protein KatS3mg015_2733 [Fimbriimonadales bacterium]|nr:MAG: hypothetical protein KatS3mg015_2186 [Fimbriimonadales bacterium]GIV03903.1 MAG: hypothetical protein KatS3mg015_2733 [Fimbriimonadales bacterium]
MRSETREMMRPLNEKFMQRFGVDVWHVLWRKVALTPEMYAFILDNLYEVSNEVFRSSLVRTVEDTDFEYDPTRVLEYAESSRDLDMYFAVSEALRNSNPAKRDLISASLLRMLREDPGTSSPLVRAAVKYCPPAELEDALLCGFPENLRYPEDVLDGLARVGTERSLNALREWRTQLSSLEPVLLKAVSREWDYKVRLGTLEDSPRLKERFFRQNLRSRLRAAERGIERAIRKLERRLSRLKAEIPDRIRNLPAIPEDSLPERITLPLSEVRLEGKLLVAVVHGRWGPHEVKFRIELPWSAGGTIRFVRMGEESDGFARLLSDATGVRARARMRDVVEWSGILVDGRLDDAERSTAMWKATHESPYCELLVEYQGAEKKIQLLEKDLDFRAALVRTVAG